MALDKLLLEPALPSSSAETAPQLLLRDMQPTTPAECCALCREALKKDPSLLCELAGSCDPGIARYLGPDQGEMHVFARRLREDVLRLYFGAGIRKREFDLSDPAAGRTLGELRLTPAPGRTNDPSIDKMIKLVGQLLEERVIPKFSSPIVNRGEVKHHY